jgi:4'-phosphopantetheinyl transferase EntD
VTAPFSEAFVRTTPFGVLAGFHLAAHDAVVPGELHESEHAHAATLSGHKRTAWIGGRLAFWRAAAELGIARGALRNGERGEPDLPEGLTGSISHKSTLAVALVSRAGGGSTVGLDLEETAPARPSIEDLALRAEERAALHALPEPERWPRLLLAFALKEALYKALHPHVKRYVRYDEAAILFPPSIELHLDGGERFDTELRIDDAPAGHVLACVRVTPRR